MTNDSIRSGQLLIVLDVDGPLNPYAAKSTRRPVGYQTFRLRPRGWLGPTSNQQRKGLRVWLDTTHGDVLGALADRTGGELVWCTTWQDDANELIAPIVGLPTLPVIRWNVDDSRWKFPAVLEYANGRPLAWFDDDFPKWRRGQGWFEDQRRATRTRLHHVSPKLGLTRDDALRVAWWYEEVDR